MYFSRLLFESNVSFFICLRSEPYNFDQRRGRNEPEAPAASSKRLYVENQPYLIGGCSPRMPLWNKMASSEPGGYKYSSVHLLKLQESQLDPPGRILSLFDKYNHMKNTYKKRLAFGKSLQMLLFVLLFLLLTTACYLDEYISLQSIFSTSLYVLFRSRRLCYYLIYTQFNYISLLLMELIYSSPPSDLCTIIAYGV